MALPALLLSLYCHFHFQLWWYLRLYYCLFTIFSIINFGGISGSIIISILSFPLSTLVASLYYHFHCQLWWHLFISYYLFTIISIFNFGGISVSIIVSLLSFPLSTLMASLYLLLSLYYHFHCQLWWHLFISYYLFTIISIVNFGGISLSLIISLLSFPLSTLVASLIISLLSFPLSTLVASLYLLLSLYCHFHCHFWWHLWLYFCLFTVISIVNFGGISLSLIVSLLSFPLSTLVASLYLLLSLYYHFHCQLWWHLFISYYLFTVISIINFGGTSLSLIISLLSFPLSTLVASLYLLLSLYYYFHCQHCWHLWLYFCLLI